jgi:hypothetical protein
MISIIYNFFKTIFLKLKRLIFRVNWLNLRSLEPVSEKFGLDRGTPIDRIYIEDFLLKNKDYIKGICLEISENTYSKKYGTNITTFEILHATNTNKNATIIGDLTNLDSLPENFVDCFICTQTYNFIFDFKKAIEGSYKLLKKNGTLLATVSGISQISKYDMDRWGDYWRFTSKSLNLVFQEIFGEDNFEIYTYGNILTSISFLSGISAEELTNKEIFTCDDNFQLLICIKAHKK